jgi:hypothetical protein
MEAMLTMPKPKAKVINVLHGANGASIPLDLSKLENFKGTVEGALRQAISQNAHPGFFETLNSNQVDIELFSAGSEGEQAVEKSLSRHDQWGAVLSEAEKCDVELGVSRHARGGMSA